MATVDELGMLPASVCWTASDRPIASPIEAPKPSLFGRTAAATIITGTIETNACAASVMARSNGSIAVNPVMIRSISVPSGVPRRPAQMRVPRIFQRATNRRTRILQRSNPSLTAAWSRGRRGPAACMVARRRRGQGEVVGAARDLDERDVGPEQGARSLICTTSSTESVVTRSGCHGRRARTGRTRARGRDVDRQATRPPARDPAGRCGQARAHGEPAVRLPRQVVVPLAARIVCSASP